VYGRRGGVCMVCERDGWHVDGIWIYEGEGIIFTFLILIYMKKFHSFS